MHRTGLRPTRWQRRLLLSVATLLLASGAGWLALHYLAGAGAGELPHPAEPWLMRLHGAGAFVALFAAGLMGGHHVPSAWRIAHRPRQAAQRRSGLLLCGLFALVAASGYALYYFAPEALRPALGWAHAAAALVMTTAGAWHGLHRSRGRAGTGAGTRANLHGL